ncbi:MAG: septum site-determining protein MinC [Bdellovibrionota bacterium]
MNFVTETIDHDSFSKSSDKPTDKMGKPTDQRGDKGDQRGDKGGDTFSDASASSDPLSNTNFGGTGESRVVTARGTEDGLVLRIDGKAEWQEILCDIDLFLGGRKKFFEGGQVSLEWLDRLPTIEQSKELEDLLQSSYGIEVIVRRRRPARMALAEPTAGRKGEYSRTEGDVVPEDTRAQDSSIGRDMSRKTSRKSGVTINLFQEVTESATGSPSAGSFASGDSFENLLSSGAELLSGHSAGSQAQGGETLSGRIQHERVESGSFFDTQGSGFTGSGFAGGFSGSREVSGAAGESTPKRYASRMAKMLGDDLFYEDDANAKVVFGTLRSGQRLETPFSLIVIGDVNPGADLVAGGDIIVFGGLRGTAHASAYDDDAFDRVIIALQMQPMQLRIGSVISRGSDELVRGAEIARIENRRIIVEAFNPRALLGKKLR